MKYFVLKIKCIGAVLLFFMSYACHKETQSAQGHWIKGTEEEKLNTIEKQFRGFDMAMVETGYRYIELYWAGKDENWEYAEYQIEKIRTTIENGLERRPKRAKSATHFLEVALPEMKEAVQSRDTTIFNRGFKTLTVNCNSCHAMEKVSFFKVHIPSVRQSPIFK